MRTITDTIFTLIDCETTSADPKTAELVEVAAIQMDATGRIFGRFESLCRPTIAIPPDNSAVHGICDRDVADAPPRAAVDRALRAFVGTGSIVIAHHAEFDRAILETPLGGHAWACSERLAHHLMPRCANYKLGTLRWTITQDPIDTAGLQAHRALADILVLRVVFLELLAQWEMAAADGLFPTGGASVENLLELSRMLYDVPTMPFGEHYGKPLADVPNSYFSWMLRKMTNLSPDLRSSVEREIERREGRSRLSGVA